MATLDKIGVATAKANQFRSRNINSIEDLVYFLPRKYKDFTHITGVQSDTEEVACVVRVNQVTVHERPGKIPTLIARCTEVSTGIPVTVLWFRQNFLYEKIYALRSKQAFVAGKATRNTRELLAYDIIMPTIFEQNQDGSRRIVPVYPSIPRMSAEYLTGKIEKAMAYMEANTQQAQICETLPQHILEENHQINMWDALCKLHFPKSMEDVTRGQARLTFDSLLYFALANEWAGRKETVGSPFGLFTLKDFFAVQEKLPYALTDDQKNAVTEMVDMIRSGKRLNALLQGDVGCGKTIVAILMMIAMAENGYQAVLMAPTQILAGQHYEDLKAIAEPLGYQVAYLRADMKAKEKKCMLELIVSGEARLVVGTHSVIGSSVQYKNLALTVVDEEHKFGVQQRADIVEKGAAGVHSITMSATPIPRTLAKAIFGDRKQIFTIKTMPNGRKPVITGISKDLNKTLRFLVKEVQQGHHAYVVCPMIEASADDKMADVDSVEAISEKFHRLLDPHGVRIETVTGKMKKAEVDEIVERFKRGELDVLISTTVIEVGVNVPEATMMIITNAERFGLSSLHQLRGRVGRSDLQSYCVLMSPQGEDNERLNAMVHCSSGFDIAEQDLRIRGAGDFIGTTQAGDNKFVSLMLAYPEEYEQAKKIARDMMERGEDCPLYEQVRQLDTAGD